jgi:ATP-dependent Clp protease ATP-binding subunit ClpA
MNVEQQTEPVKEGRRKSFIELNSVVENRDRIGRHIAQQIFLDGFLPMERPTSAKEQFRSTMNQRIIGQPSAIDAIVSGLDTQEIRGENDKKPIATLAFLGPTGVGKSETAKVLAELLGADTANLVKIDCSNYSQGHEIANLTGSPFGYVGSESPALLSKKRIEQPGTVVLFDEIEKGSQPLYNLMLQIMDDGELPLKNGSVTSFRDTVIIITSNLGAKKMRNVTTDRSVGFGNPQRITDKKSLENIATKDFEEYFNPEFINRLDKLVVFHPLDEESLAGVLQSHLQQANVQLEESFGIRLSLSEATVDHLVQTALEKPEFGARPLIRAFKQNVQSTLGQYHGSNEIAEGSEIRVFHRDEFPEDHPSRDGRQLVFASREDSSIKRKVEPDPIATSKVVATVNFSNNDK